MIEKIKAEDWVGRPVQESFVIKMNQIIDELNRLAVEPVPHAHRDICGGPAIGTYDSFMV
jgi:hypothetical protein